MKKKRHPPGPVPPGNRTDVGPGAPPPTVEGSESPPVSDAGAPFSEQDPKRRLGDYTTEGEHSIVQPGGKNDANRDR